MALLLILVVIMLLQRLVRDMYKILSEENYAAENPQELKKLPDTYTEFLSEIHDHQYDGRTFAIRLRAMVCSTQNFVHIFIIVSNSCLLVLAGWMDFMNFQNLEFVSN